jgi:hypothetical protein
MQKECLHSLYSSSYIIRVITSSRMILVGCVARTGKIKNAFTILVEIPERKRPLERPKRK